MISYRDILNGLRLLQIEPGSPVLAHASLASFGEVRGGGDTVLGALLSLGRVMMPVFTFKTMLIPEEGPEDNGIAYGSGEASNRMAEFFSRDMPADIMMGFIPEKLRQMPTVHRSTHPILSFCGIGVEEILDNQTLEEPLAPIRALAEQGGWVLLLGVDHTVNTSIHYGEYLAGRKQFTRWALTADGVRACQNYPGCSNGFQAIEPYLKGMTRSVRVGNASIQAVQIGGLVDTVQALIESDPLALLCDRPDCDRCTAVRHSVSASSN